MTMTIAVTGATGLLGRSLCASLVEQGLHVRAFIRGGGGAPAEGVSPQRVVDLDDVDGLREGCRGAEVVVHLAARVHQQLETRRDAAAEYVRTNVEGTRNVLEAARRAGAAHVILLSSVKAVGASNVRPWTEDQTPAPVDPYGRSKLAMERLGAEFGARTGMRTSVLRLPLVYGAGATANVYRLMAVVDAGWPLPLGSVTNRRSLIYLENAVAAVIALLEARSSASGVFFASDGVDFSTPELIRVIASALGRPARLLPVPVPVLRAVGRLGDGLPAWVPFPVTTAGIDRLTRSLTVADCRLRAATGFRPPLTPEEGWRRTAEWFRTTRRRR